MEALAAAVHFLLYLDLMLLFGVNAFALYALSDDARMAGTVLPLAGLTAAAASGGILLSVLGIMALAAKLGGAGLLAVDADILRVLLFDTANGTAWQWRIAALVIALLAAWGSRQARRPTAAALVVALAGGVALASLAWGGHGAIGEGAFGWFQLAADIVHLLAAGIWVGALAAMLMLVLWPRGAAGRGHLLLTHRVLAGFSVTGTMVVGLLIGTGLLNLIGISGWRGLATLPANLYGQLLFAKLILFGIMLGLAAANRFRFVPLFDAALAADDAAGALSVLRRSLTIETACAAAILALVAWLGTVDPAG